MSGYYDFFYKGSKSTDEAISVGDKAILDETKDTPAEKEVKDDSPWVQNLRNLYRSSRINKEQYIGGLATLVATGMITKAEFTRLQKAAT